MENCNVTIYLTDGSILRFENVNLSYSEKCICLDWTRHNKDYEAEFVYDNIVGYQAKER